MGNYKTSHLSNPQIDIWNLEELHKNTSINNLSYNIHIKEKLKIGKIQEAINTVILANESMRLQFTVKEGQPEQYISDYCYYSVEVVDYSNQTIAEVSQYERSFSAKLFKITDSFLFDFKIVLLPNNENVLLMKVHHIISDAWSTGLIISQILEAYNDGCQEQRNTQSYLQFVEKEKNYIGSAHYNADKEFWEEYLKDCPPPLVLSESPRNTSDKCERWQVEMDSDLANKLNQYCLQNNLTPYAVFMSALSLYIGRVASSNDIVISTPRLNRDIKTELETIGMFVSSIPLRITIDENHTFIDMCKYTAQESRRLSEHKGYPFSRILEDLYNNQQSKGSITNFAMSFQKTRIKTYGTQIDMFWNAPSNQQEQIVMHVVDYFGNGRYTILYDYLVDLFDQKEIKRLNTRLMSLINDAIEFPDKGILDLNIMCKDEENSLLYEFNATKADYPREKTIHQLFEEQVAKLPDNPAVIACDKQLSYAELNSRANRIAHALLKKGIQKEDIVAFMLPRRADVLSAMLGILKAGGAFLPIDPKYPENRIEHVLKDSAANYVITTEEQKNRVNTPGIILTIEELVSNDCEENPEIAISSDSLCYVIYTSGSTGKPKGVMIEHKNLNNYSQANSHNAETEAFVKLGTRALAIATVAFDVAMIELVVPLLNGMTVVMANENEANNPLLLAELITRQAVDVMTCTPSFLANYCEEKEFADALQKMAVITVGAEVFPKKLLKKIRTLTKAKILNCYGPTETTISSSGSEPTEHINIGKPYANTQVYILDGRQKLLPIGVSGEICIGGDGVGRGYLNHLELTAEKFINWRGQRIYRTGDLAKFNNRGEIEFIGRIDDQVKLRGLRIELGEIEACMQSFPGLDASVVIVREAGENKHLCGYFTASSKLEIATLKEHLAKSLTYYMVPERILQLETMPLTPNGKIDKKALPEIEFLAEEAVLPQNERQQKIHDIITKEILLNSSLGVKDNLLMAGLNSLSAIRLATKLSKAFGCEFAAKNVLEYNTIETLEKILLTTASMTQDEVFEILDFYPITSNQRRLYHACAMAPDSEIYNIPLEMKMSAKVPVDKLVKALSTFIDAHPTMKTRFRKENEELVQYVNTDERTDVELIDVTQEDYQRIRESFVQPFNLLQDCLYRIKVYRTKEASYVLFDIHHIIFDGMSMEIFLSELQSAYDQQEIVPEIYTCFTYALEEQKKQTSEEYLLAKEFFMNKFKGIECETVIPADYPHSDNTDTTAADSITQKISEEFGKRVVDFCSRTGITANTVFLAALEVVLSKYNSSPEVVLGTVSSGRNSAKYANSIGMFVQTIPLYVKLDYTKTIRDILDETQRDVFQSIAHEIYPFDQLVESLNIKREPSRTPLFDIIFVYQGMQADRLELDGEHVEFSPFMTHQSDFAISINVVPVGSGFSISADYRRARYKKETISRLLESLVYAVKFMVENSDKLLKETEIISEMDLELLTTFNATQADYAREKTIHQLLEEQVEKTPDRLAVAACDLSLTYRELNARANRLAQALIKIGAVNEDIIAFMLPRKADIIAVIFGILKAGGAFLPIDPEYPEDRIEHVLTDSQAKYIITTEDVKRKRTIAGNVITIEELLLCENSDDPAVPMNSDGLCYVIYTSGSTGKPKGVMIEHRNLHNYSQLNEHNCMIKAAADLGSKILAIATIAFDLSITEIIPMLINGISVILADEEETNNPLLLAKLITKNKVDVMFFTPSRVQSLCDEPAFAEVLGQMKVIMIGAEAFPKNLLEKLRSLTEAKLFNGYGPTETTIGSSFLEIDQQITIGKPIANTRLYILDNEQRLLPIGVAGELCIAGDGVGRGYWNRSDLTTEKFIPFMGQTVYRTGDLARYNNRGEIDYIGRMDNQVKLRGLRIELGEIEACMQSFPGLDTSVVIVREVGENKHLCGYFTASDKLDITKLKEHLAKSLTYYMVPDRILQLESMPLTPNGKIDKKALPEIEFTIENEYIAPQSETESVLSGIIANLLQLDRVGITDNFFEIGGNSLLVTRFVIQAKAKNIPIAYPDVFKYPTIKAMCQNLNTGSTGLAVDNDIVSYNYSGFEELLACNTIVDDVGQNPLGNVLLTGATGFLGAHLLKEFLDNYDGQIVCLIRAKDRMTVEQRLKSTLFYYFENSYDDLFGKRIFAVEGDITSVGLLSQTVNAKIDTVVNSAADVKHFSHDDSLATVNVEGVKNIIAYCLKNNKQLIHISTISVAGESVPKATVFTEQMFYVGQIVDNKYVRSKFFAERYLLEAINKGLSAKIMRVGNLMGRFSDGEFQVNSAGNAYMSRIKSYVGIGKIPQEILDLTTEYSPIDCTAAAILKLAQTDKRYTVFHPYNNNSINLAETLKAMELIGYPIEIVSKEEFEQFVKQLIEQPAQAQVLAGIISDLDNNGSEVDSEPLFNCDFTVALLDRLGLKFPKISQDYLVKYLRALESLGFFDSAEQRS